MSIFSTYRWLRACCGVELHTLADGEFECRLCSISTIKNSLNIESKTEVRGDIASVIEILPAGQPLALSFTGKGVLTKTVPLSEERGKVELGDVFPNLDFSQFYIQQFEGAGVCFISIVRREIIDEVLKELYAAGRQVLLISLGAFAVSSVLSQINTYGEELRFSGYEIQYNKELEWTGYLYSAELKSDFPLKIDLEPLPEQYLIAYSIAFELALYHRLSVVAIEDSPAEAELQEFRQKQIFRIRAGLILSGFLALLIINFTFFSYYASENNKMLSRVSRSSADVQSFLKLQRETAGYEQLLKEIGWHKGIRYSWLADQIGRSVPTTVKLQELSIGPENTKGVSGQKINFFETGKIRLKGEAAELKEINEWIYCMKGWIWVRQVTLENFGPGQDVGIQEFTIDILY